MRDKTPRILFLGLMYLHPNFDIRFLEVYWIFGKTEIIASANKRIGREINVDKRTDPWNCFSMNYLQAPVKAERSTPEDTL